jgi:hypothetical protein
MQMMQIDAGDFSSITALAELSADIIYPCTCQMDLSRPEAATAALPSPAYLMPFAPRIRQLLQV